MDFLYPKESFIIRGVSFEIYKNLGSGHKEKIYHNAYALGLVGKGLSLEKEKRIDIFYNNQKVGIYVPDLVINGIIIIELKAKPKLSPEDIKQFWHYLKGTEYKLGFLINFGALGGVEIKRIIYDKARKKSIAK